MRKQSHKSSYSKWTISYHYKEPWSTNMVTDVILLGQVAVSLGFGNGGAHNKFQRFLKIY